MLTRPKPSPTETDADARRRALRREQQRRHRARLRHGQRAYVIELSEPVLDMLVRLHWIDDRATGDDHQVARAVERMLDDAAK